MPEILHISDRPAEADAFGRNHFARSLARSIVSVGADDGLVIGIEGSWGTGKSTVIGFIKRHLIDPNSDHSKTVIVEFNPWMVSNTGAMVDALVTQIAAALNVTQGAQEERLKVGEKLLSYIGLIKHLKYLKYVPGVSFAGHIAQDAAEAAEAIAGGVEGAQKALEDVEKMLPQLDLTRKKAEAVEALRKLNRNIVVIVDDLDRLPEDEIQLVVQTIKAVADFPRTTYLLAYDREIVAAALGGGNVARGQSYLEKIVQVAYPIPPLFRYQLRGFLDTKLQEFFTGIHIELRDYESAIYQSGMEIVTYIARHPRDIVRLLNRLLLSLPATRGEVNAVDVIVFEAISQRFPSIRDSVHRHPTDFIGQSFRGDSGAEDAAAGVTDWSTWTDSLKHQEEHPWEKHLPIEESERDVARRACAFLFALTPDKKGKVPEDELRMVDPDRLARFFRMASLDSVPEAASIHQYLENSASLEETLATCNSSDLAFLLEWIFNYTPSCHCVAAYNSIEKLVDAASKVLVEGELTDRLAELFGKVILRLVRRAPDEERSKCLSQMCSSGPLSIAEIVLLEAVAEQGKWVIRPEMVLPQEQQLIPDSQAVDRAIAAWSDRVRKSASDGDLINETRVNSILYRFAQLNFAYDETYKIVSGICSTDDGLKRFLSIYVEDSLFNSLESFSLIADANFLAGRIRGSAMSDEYAWLADLISNGDYPRAIDEQARGLKGLNRAHLEKARGRSGIPT